MQNEGGFGWFMSANLKCLVEEIDFLLAERRELSARGPHFRIVHRFRMPGADCTPGEEIFAVSLVHRGHEYHLRLSLALRILVDYLARHSRVPQSARQIELGIRASDFYKWHAANASGRTVTRGIPRSYVKVYVSRLHRAFSVVFRDAAIGIDPGNVLIRQKTAGNEVGYQLQASWDWVHVDLTSRNCQPLRGGNGGRRNLLPIVQPDGFRKLEKQDLPEEGL